MDQSARTVAIRHCQPGSWQCRQEIYATAAITKIAAYLALHAEGLPRLSALGVGMCIVIALRLIAIRWDLNLPVVRKA